MKNNNRHHGLFSKALFKQSIKANGLMWLIITAAVCFMLACVMLISGTSNISSVKDGVQNTIIEELIKSEIRKSTLNLYESSNDSEYVFDNSFVEKFNELNTKANYDELTAIKTNASNEAYQLVSANVTEKVTNEVTNRITAEIQARVESEATVIKNEVTAKVTTDMASQEASQMIAEKMTSGKDQATAINEVKEYYVQLETTNVTNAHIAKATADLTTDEHKNTVTNTVLNEKKDEYTELAKAELADELNEISTKATNDTTAKFKELYVVPSYTYAVDKVSAKYPNEGDTKSKYGAAMVTINPSNKADEEYTSNKEAIPSEYVENLTTYMLIDVNSYEESTTPSTYTKDYISSEERDTFRDERAYNAVSMLIASKLTSQEYKTEILKTLSSYKVTAEQYDQMGFDYKNVKNISYESMLECQNMYDYEVSQLSDEIKSDDTKLNEAKKKIHDDLYLSVAGSLLDKLPQNVSDGIEELGTMDLYGLIVGSIFFKMAGLLLPIIYVIMVSNSLVATQVDTGSMAYVLSTSTRREEVTFTQSLFLILSIFLMFVCTTITSIICFNIANVTTDLTVGKLVLINLGAFLTLFAISGLNFLTSCFFDRSKKAMALGGGVSIFFLVATMLGLFGSPVIPSVVRISALNNFNYVSIISLFDVVSILDGTNAWGWKISILVIIGIVGYIVGAIKFKKKDLPL